MLPRGNYVRNRPVSDPCIRMLPRGRSVRAQKERAAVYLLPDGYYVRRAVKWIRSLLLPPGRVMH